MHAMFLFLVKMSMNEPLSIDDPHQIQRYIYSAYPVKHLRWIIKKQPSRGVLKKRCSENMQQIAP